MDSRQEQMESVDHGGVGDADAAFGRLLRVLNSGMLALMISIGDRTGLFRTLRSMPASTSAEIATAARLNERYVREWLAAMTVGGIVVHNPAEMTFELPAAYAEALATGMGNPEGLAGVCQHVAMLGKVEDRIVDCFRQGGGVSYDTFAELWDVRAEPYDLDDCDPMTVNHVLALLPETAERLDQGIDVADVGCGNGWQLNLLARRFPASRFVGFELTENESLRIARVVAERDGLTNVSFRQKDAATLDGSDNSTSS